MEGLHQAWGSMSATISFHLTNGSLSAVMGCGIYVANGVGVGRGGTVEVGVTAVGVGRGVTVAVGVAVVVGVGRGGTAGVGAAVGVASAVAASAAGSSPGTGGGSPGSHAMRANARPSNKQPFRTYSRDSGTWTIGLGRAEDIWAVTLSQGDVSSCHGFRATVVLRRPRGARKMAVQSKECRSIPRRVFEGLLRGSLQGLCTCSVSYKRALVNSI